MRPLTVPSDIAIHNQPNLILEPRLPSIREGFKKLDQGNPEVSVVIPAFNEETDLLKTLSCLSASITNRSVEVIVVNNNSTDDTESLVTRAGARCVNENKQGITPARNAGLAAAKGKYILNADADTLYPPNWIELMAAPLDNDTVCCVYGRFGFIPTAGISRKIYFFYEYVADWLRLVNKNFREEAVNVYGFNSGFKREQGLSVEGFNHPPSANEDGWLALKLKTKGYGRLKYVTDVKAMVWTTDRRIQMDGGLRKGLAKRFRRLLGQSAEIRTDLGSD